ncbi:MAG TPA: EscU/YscU/HrcU family type III secretion system export apparatus switch protein [Acidimicrobiales bacterium]|nr:EscU/YscU/HrcU family type III secretion system export apparatus switch protein [Acidimicrobiales bacterium]
MSEERTEKATPKRRRELRRKGTVARSAELPQAIVLLVVVVLLPTTIRHLVTTVTQDWRLALGTAASATPKKGSAVFGKMLLDSAGALAPMIGALALASVTSQLVMSGFKPNFMLIKPKFEKINPKNGIKRLVSKQVIWELLKTMGKVGALALVTIGVWKAGVSNLLTTPRTLSHTVSATGNTLRTLLLRVVVLSMLIGIADAVVAKRRYLKQSRMTKQEVKDEHKQNEGNPHAKSAMRTRAIKLSRSRMIAAVAKADAVLVNPTHLAIAIKYEQGSAAPIVLAKGAGVIAEKIRDEATKHGVPIIENKPLVRAMFRKVEVGDMIPAAFYRAIAEVLALVYRTRRRSRFAPLPSKPLRSRVA